MRIEFTTHTLDNGLRVLVHEDPTVAKAAFDLCYRVGARDERPQRTGMAHLFEHLMFGGSKHVPDYDVHVQRIGGENNAFTSNDLTNYYVTCPAAQLETVFWLESDRMLELDFSQKSLDVQISVVCEEFKQRYLNQPYGDAWLHLRPLHYTRHPYRWMTIGQTLEQIEAVTLDEVREFFFSFYAPNNATLAVAGGVKTDEVLRLAEKWFGPIPRRNTVRPERTAEPPQTEARSKTISANVPHTAVFKAYHIPARADDGYYAADLLTDLLANGKASRLYRHLVQDTQIATRVSAYSWGLYDPGMISIDARLTPGRSVKEYEAELNVALDGLRKEASEEELRRIQTKVEAMETFDKAAVLNRAMSLATYDYLGDPDLVNTNLERYQRLTLDDVHEAYDRYLRPDNCSTLYYLPETE